MSNSEGIGDTNSRRVQRIRLFGFVILLVVVFIGVTAYPYGLESFFPESGAARDFLSIPLQDIDGNMVYLEDFEGKVVVLEFMATWCLTCAQQEIILKELYPKYEFENVVVFAVSIDPAYDTADVIRNHIEKKNIPWQITRDTSLMLTRYFQVSELSTIMIITPDGEVVNEFIGFTGLDTLSRAIDILL